MLPLLIPRPVDERSNAMMISRTLCSLLMILFPLAAVAAPLPTPVTVIVAVVNDDIITSWEVSQAMQPVVKEAEKKAPLTDAARNELRSNVIKGLIDKKLAEQKIKELNIKVSDEELRQSIEDVKKQNNLTQEALVAALAAQGLTYEQYKNQLRDQLERLRLVSQEVKSKIQVSEQEMMDYYWANKSLFAEDESFRARHIFIKIPKNATDKELDAINARVETIWKETQGSADFAVVAGKYSEDATAKDGGNLGLFKKGDMQGEFVQLLDRLKPGEVSGIIRTPSGFHIVKLEERIPGRVKTFEEVKPEIEDRLYKKKSEERFNQWLVELKKEATIEIRP
jgi:peptidyl-prolyl cis-trans isomerase SurA